MGDSDRNLKDGFRIGPWTVLPVAGELVGSSGEVQHLEPKVMDVFVALAQAHPDVLEREAAIRTVWKGRPVSDDGLARCVTLLRKALGDSRTEPRFIQTVPKRGYRLLVPVNRPAIPHGLDADAVSESVESWTGPLEFDNLKILRLLGRGSMGVVHLAQEVNLERLVAVKSLRGVIGGDGRAQKRFRREAAAAARIDHPNVTSVYRLGQLADGTSYIVMQFVRGRTLRALMASSGDVSATTGTEIIRQVAEGLACAHRERVIHRDVKPSNILIEQGTNVAMLSDFGIAGMQETGARVATRLTLHGEVLGDARYISPEQAQGEPATPASDIFSLGVVAYELLTGVHPFEDRGSVAEFPQGAAPPRPLSELNGNVTSSVERLVMQLLAKKADERPTAEQLAAALADTMEWKTIPDIRAPIAENRLSKWVIPFAVIGAVVLAAVFLLARD